MADNKNTDRDYLSKKIAPKKNLVLNLDSTETIENTSGIVIDNKKYIEQLNNSDNIHLSNVQDLSPFIIDEMNDANNDSEEFAAKTISEIANEHINLATNNSIVGEKISTEPFNTNVTNDELSKDDIYITSSKIPIPPKEQIVPAKLSLNESQKNMLQQMLAKNKKILIVTFILMIVSLIVCVIFITLSSLNKTPKITKNTDITPYTDILTEEEKKEWSEKKLAQNEVTMQINQKIEVNKNTSEAHLRLINPPYSNFATQVDIILLDDGDGGTMEETVYSSEVLEPGTVVDYANLSTKFSTGTYNAKAVFNFYNSLDTLVGTYGTSLELDVT